MSREDLRLISYLEHMTAAIERINRYTCHVDLASFLKDELIQDAVVRNLEIIGEASRNIATRFPEFHKTHPELPLTAAYQMRNAIAHGYFQVDFEMVWRTVHHDLPDFGSQLDAALASMRES